MPESVLDQQIALRNATMQAAFDSAPDKTLAIDPSHYLEVEVRARVGRMLAHRAVMEPSAEMAEYAGLLRKRFKSQYAQMWHTIVDWPTAVLVAVWGEEPDAGQPGCDPTYKGWPLAYGDLELGYAKKMAEGTYFPPGMVLLPVEG